MYLLAAFQKSKLQNLNCQVIPLMAILNQNKSCEEKKKDLLSKNLDEHCILITLHSSKGALRFGKRTFNHY